MDVQYPLATVGALVVGPTGNILIAKTTKWRGSWGIPGGKVDWGETLETALKREFQEEVGLSLHHIQFALVQEAVRDSQFYKDAHFILMNYYARCDQETIVPNEEIDEWAWVHPQTALTYPLNTYTEILIKDYLTTNPFALRVE
ncbi:MAG: NUDIX domain-containing protein [Merismopedia sp. SIO2A8]|nr:NUDIX domain-containing protein [Merismopedia sp. SIO2A8]